MLVNDRCANCDRAIDGADQKFCPACGQPTPAHRIDWHFLAHEIEHSLLHMDRGVLYSLRELMLRPGHLMRGYLEGRRAQQVKPLLLLMMSAAAVLLLSKYFLGGDFVGSSMQDGFSQGKTVSGGGAIDPALVVKAMDDVKNWINAHLTALTLLYLPIEAAVFRLVFRKSGLNYPEWLVVSVFLTVQAFVFMAVSTVARPWFPSAQTWITAIVLAYNAASLVQLFRDQPRWKTALRAILGLGLFVAVQIILGVIALALLLVIRS